MTKAKRHGQTFCQDWWRIAHLPKEGYGFGRRAAGTIWECAASGCRLYYGFRTGFVVAVSIVGISKVTRFFLEVEPTQYKIQIIEVTKQLHFFCELRSEEHTSELQSLMRISYAVFC